LLRDPPHPGEILWEDVLSPLGLEVKEAAEYLCMSRVALSRVVNGVAGIRPDLAIRLEKAGISTARFWMTLQVNFDLVQAMRQNQPPVRILQR
jgi:antitoxin HigA-1